jgi:hypothetical protein
MQEGRCAALIMGQNNSASSATPNRARKRRFRAQDGMEGAGMYIDKLPNISMNSIPVHRAPVSSLRASPSAFDLAPTPLIILHGTAVTAVLSTNQAARLRPSHFCGLQASCQSAKLLLLITAIRTSAQIPVLFARSNRFADTYPGCLDIYPRHPRRWVQD